MPPKQRTSAPTGAPTTTSTPARSSKPSSSAADAQDILQGIWNKYVSKTPQRVKLLDTFLAFLVVVGALQFFYVVLVGNFVRPRPRTITLDFHSPPQSPNFTTTAMHKLTCPG
jgi:oligosaccharyltransferase complex subunit epsilon